MMTSEATKIAVKAPKEPKRFVFVLLDRFTLLSFASAIECLRIANRMAEEELYSWVLTGDSEDVITCSAGVRFNLDFALSDLNREDVVLVCGGMDVQKAATKRMLNWLRREARKGLRMGGCAPRPMFWRAQGFWMASARRSIGKTMTVFSKNSRMSP